MVKSVNKDLIVMVDNCYGEFLDTKEPPTIMRDAPLSLAKSKIM